MASLGVAAAAAARAEGLDEREVQGRVANELGWLHGLRAELAAFRRPAED